MTPVEALARMQASRAADKTEKFLPVWVTYAILALVFVPILWMMLTGDSWRPLHN